MPLAALALLSCSLCSISAPAGREEEEVAVAAKSKASARLV